MTGIEMQKRKQAQILIVDDTQANLMLLNEMLTNHGYRVRPASNGRLALRSVAASPPDLILLDVRMPDMDGYEVCRRLKSDEISRGIPVIFISALDSVADKVRGFEVGGIDYIIKPFQEAEVLARVETHLSLRFLQKELELQNIQLHKEISARMRFEDELKRHQESLEERIAERTRELNKLSQAVEQSPVSIIITDTNGIVEFVNSKFIQLSGFTFDEAFGTTPSILKPETTSPEVHTTIWSTITSGNVWEGEFLNTKKNGETYSERATISPIRDKEGVISHYLAIQEDITERKLLEQQLLQSQKMESIGRLAGGVAHDFNNMLGVIQGCTQLALRKVPEGDKLWTFLNQISEATRRSIEITRQLLAFSRKQIVSPKPLDINAHIIETQATLGRLVGEDIVVTFNLAEDIGTIKMDPSQLDQILMNLAANARDAMTNGGYLTLETANISIDETYSRYHPESSPGEYVRLTVSDNGPGIDRQTLAHIFEPFFTTKGAGKGTGLGLSTVYGILRQNGGFVNVYSEPGHGTTFQLYFPRFSGTITIESKISEDVASESGTVLLVEDDKMMRDMAIQLMEQIGYTVIQAKSPREAIATCKSEDTHIDIILTDVVMPELNGKEMIDIIKSLRPGIKVLFMSGYTPDFVAQHGVVNEGTHFIQKPFTMKTLSDKIKKVLLATP